MSYFSMCGYFTDSGTIIHILHLVTFWRLCNTPICLPVSLCSGILDRILPITLAGLCIHGVWRRSAGDIDSVWIVSETTALDLSVIWYFEVTLSSEFGTFVFSFESGGNSRWSKRT